MKDYSVHDYLDKITYEKVDVYNGELCVPLMAQDLFTKN